MGKLEKDVMKEVKTALTNLELEGAVLWWERLNSGKVRTEFGSWIQLCRNGTPDFVIIVKGVQIYFVECKGEKGKQDDAQIDFMLRCHDWATYEVIRDAKQVQITVERLTNHYRDKLNAIEF